MPLYVYMRLIILFKFSHYKHFPIVCVGQIKWYISLMRTSSTINSYQDATRVQLAQL